MHWTSLLCVSILLYSTFGSRCPELNTLHGTKSSLLRLKELVAGEIASLRELSALRDAEQEIEVDLTQSFEDWCREKASLHPYLEFRRIERGNVKKAGIKQKVVNLLSEGGMGVFAVSPISRGETLVDVDIKYVLRVKDVERLPYEWKEMLTPNSTYFSRKEFDDGRIEVQPSKTTSSNFALLALVLLYEHHAQHLSGKGDMDYRDTIAGEDMSIYHDSLPAPSTHGYPATWPQPFVDAIKNTTIGRVIGQLRPIFLQEYKDMIDVEKCSSLCESGGAVSFEMYVWARSIVRAYAFSVGDWQQAQQSDFTALAVPGFIPPEANAPDTGSGSEIEPMLVPCLDRFNHRSLGPKGDFEGASATAILDINTDEEVFFSYGSTDNRILLAGYGFVDLSSKGVTFQFLDVIDLKALLYSRKRDSDDMRIWKLNRLHEIVEARVPGILEGTLRVPAREEDFLTSEAGESSALISALRILHLSENEILKYSEDMERRVISEKNEALVWLTLEKGLQERAKLLNDADRAIGTLLGCFKEAGTLLSSEKKGGAVQEWSRRVSVGIVRLVL